jgi:serine/threonine protein kinase
MKGFVWCPHCGSPHALSTVTCPTTGKPLATGLRRPERGLPPGSLIAQRYRVQRWGIEESVSLLYDATQIGTNRRVWVKVVDENSPAREERAAEILEMEREARAACMIEHPNVSPVLDFGTLGEGTAFLVRERAAGQPLAAMLGTEGVLEVHDAVDIVTQILSGLHALHLAGIVHRDPGTHNVFMVHRTGCRPVAKIAGLGRCSAPNLGAPPDAPSGVHYSSPELLSGGVVDARSDLFACGVILFEMLTGRRPFEAPSLEEVRSAILRDERASASQLKPLLGAEWLAVFDKALHKDPAQRHQSASAFQAALPLAVRQKAGVLRIVTADDGESTNTDSHVIPSDMPPPSRRGVNGPSRCNPFIGRSIAKKYLLESLLGSGSAGAVYKAMHVDLKRPVAVKVLHDRNRRSSQALERFKSEALVTSMLDHPNITRVLDAGEEPDGTAYLVMEYLEGQSLEAVIAAHVRLTPDRAVKIAIQMASSLVVSHSAGIIHRDVKPENIIVLPDRDEDGRPADLVKVCDFGLAKLCHPAEGSEELTGIGVILGSPVYMAPEQIRGVPCDERADIYAAAVTLFEMLTGRWPHDAEKVTDLFQKKLTEPATPLSSLLPSVDPLLEDIVMRALDVNPQMRHGSALELKNELVVALKELRTPPPLSTNTVSIWPDRPQ